MPKIKDQPRFVIECDCGHPAHTAFITYNAETGLFFMNVNLLTGGIITRLKSAFRYIFSNESNYGEYCEIVLNEEEAQALATFLSNNLGKES